MTEHTSAAPEHEWIERPGLEGRLTAENFVHTELVSDRLDTKYGHGEWMMQSSDRHPGFGKILIRAALRDKQE